MAETTKTKFPAKVKMVTPKGKEPKIIYHQTINAFARLGAEVKITPKANTTINAAGFKLEMFVESVEVLIGIGNDHTASLIMTVDAWKALRDGGKIHITTTQEFKKKYGN